MHEHLTILASMDASGECQSALVTRALFYWPPWMRLKDKRTQLLREASIPKKLSCIKDEVSRSNGLDYQGYVGEA